jgi:hypothetical protein
MLFLAEGDINTKFYHLQAYQQSRKNRIDSLNMDGVEVVQDAEMANTLYSHYVTILGENFERTKRFHLHALGLPHQDLAVLEHFFTVEEVWSVITELPNDKVPRPDGFTRLFYKLSWDTIRDDIMTAFNSFWSQDSKNFNHLNDAFMVLLKKKDHLAVIHDYHPISLIYSFSKLVTKCLARRLASILDSLVMHNRSAFIRGWRIHDNFRQVQITCKAIHARRSPTILLKVDIARVFDMVSWVFLLELL